MGSRGQSSPKTNKSIFGANTKEVKSIDESKYKGYAKQLAREANQYAADERLVIYSNGKGEAFISYDEDSGTISGIGSTGGRAGTELLARIIETETAKGKTVQWMADNPQAIKYYRQMGLQAFAIANERMTVLNYRITPERAQRALERLRKK